MALLKVHNYCLNWKFGGMRGRGAENRLSPLKAERESHAFILECGRKAELV